MNLADQVYEIIELNVDLDILLRFSYIISAVMIFLWFISNAYQILVCRAFGRVGLLITGIIGVPVHELTHAIFAIIFGHKISKIVFFQFKRNENTLGWVEHSYNTKSIRGIFGVFFIALAPILLGPVIIGLSLRLSNVRIGNETAEVIYHWLSSSSTALDFSNLILAFVSDFLSMSISNLLVFVVLGCISLHSAPSISDIRTIIKNPQSLVGLALIPTILYLMMFIHNGYYLLELIDEIANCCLLATSMLIASLVINCIILLTIKLKNFQNGPLVSDGSKNH